MIALKNIEKHYALDNEKIEVLKNINLELHSGELTYLLGESGCGKSTLLHIIGGIDQANKGEYFFNQQNLFHLAEREWAQFRREKVGFVFQSFNLIPHLTALENVEMSMILNGLSKSERRKKALELLKLVGLENRSGHLPNQLSGGQKQRIAIARALANDPDIILADEPTGALDSENSVQIMQILKNISQQGKIVLVVTHSKELVSFTDRIITMKDGMILSTQVKTEKEKEKHDTPKKNKSEIGNKNTRHSRIDFFTSLKLSLRNIKNKKWRNLLTAFGASIGIFGILIIGALGNGINDRISSTMNDNDAKPYLYVTSLDSTLLDENHFKEIHDIDGVKYVSPYNPIQISIENGEKESITISSSTLVPKAHQSIYGDKYISNGEFPDKGINEIVIPKRIASDLFSDPEIAIGQTVNLTAQLMSIKKVYKTVEIDAKISGITPNEKMKILDKVGLSYDLSEAIMNTHEETANQAFAYIAVPSNPDEIEEIKAAIQKKDYKALVEGETSKDIKSYVDMATLALGLLSAISLIVSSIMIGIVLYVSVLERTKEIGILKAIGANNKDIRRIFVTEGFSIGIIGGIIGAAGSFLAGITLNIIVKNVMDVSFDLFQYNFIETVLIIGFSAFIGILASFIPAFKASRQNALDALRYE
ncbi:MAG: ATP-binding cassette domain-containing protein [Solibacillus sp.]